MLGDDYLGDEWWPCPVCGADPGDACTDRDAGEISPYVHAERADAPDAAQLAHGVVIDRHGVRRLPDGVIVQREPDDHGGPYASVEVWRGGIRRPGSTDNGGLIGTAPNGWRVLSVPA